MPTCLKLTPLVLSIAITNVFSVTGELCTYMWTTHMWTTHVCYQPPTWSITASFVTRSTYVACLHTCCIMSCGPFKVCLHKPWFSVSDATAASDTAQKIGLFLSLDVAVASDTENHCPCK
jgi:hypothetical protein